MRIAPVENWRKSWSWLSVQIPAINAAFLATWALLPAKFQDALPPVAVICISVALIVLGVAGRLLDQSGVKK